MRALQACVALALLTTGVKGLLDALDGGKVDLCKTGTLYVKDEGMTGFLHFDRNSIFSSSSYCVLKIETCSWCKLSLQSLDTVDFKCPQFHHSTKRCSLSCDNLAIFDAYYMNETVTYYQELQENREFMSLSSKVNILFCHNQMNYNFTLQYMSIKKEQMIFGASNVDSEKKGIIISPLFPMEYAQNHETYEYVLTSHREDDYIQLVFDDWHLASTSALQFDKSNIVGPVYGQAKRPVVVSDSNILRVKFHTGRASSPGEGRDFMGFKATYQFFNNRYLITRPQTICGGYLLNSSGGTFKFQPESVSRRYYDCIWVVKAQPGYDGILLKIIDFSVREEAYTDVDQVRIFSGLNSEGVQQALVLGNTRTFQSYRNSEGFYVRLNATFQSVDQLKVAYASYKDTSTSLCYRDDNMFQCNNRLCIDKDLVCDGFDHCGDNTDETTGCKESTDHWANSYQYTITVGVIVPMVVSVFLVMIICLLFIMIRRCRQARLQELNQDDRLQTLSEEVGRRRGRSRGRRRRLRNLFDALGQSDSPPTYDEAIQSPPPWYLNVAFGNMPADPSLPQPPSYSEAVGEQSEMTNRLPHDSPSSTDTSQSELSVYTGHQSSSSSGTEMGSRWGNSPLRRQRNISYSSDSDMDIRYESERNRTSATEASEPACSSTASSPLSSRQESRPEGEQTQRGKGKNKKSEDISVQVSTSNLESKKDKVHGVPRNQQHAGSHSCSDQRRSRSDDQTQTNRRISKSESSPYKRQRGRRQTGREFVESDGQYSPSNREENVDSHRSDLQINVSSAASDIPCDETGNRTRNKGQAGRRKGPQHRKDRNRSQGSGQPADHATQTEPNRNIPDRSGGTRDLHRNKSLQALPEEMSAGAERSHTVPEIPYVNQTNESFPSENTEFQHDAGRSALSKPAKHKRKNNPNAARRHRQSEKHDHNTNPTPYLAESDQYRMVENSSGIPCNVVMAQENCETDYRPRDASIPVPCHRGDPMVMYDEPAAANLTTSSEQLYYPSVQNSQLSEYRSVSVDGGSGSGQEVLDTAGQQHADRFMTLYREGNENEDVYV